MKGIQRRRYTGILVRMADWKQEIRAIRAAHGLTQATFAQRLGVSLVTVKFWETGQRSPSPHAVEQLRAFAALPLPAVQPPAVPPPLRAPAPAPAPPAPAAATTSTRRVLHIKDALAKMGLQTEGRAGGRASDRTIRTALKTGRLPGWRSGDGAYRDGIAEWCFYEHDFERWLAVDYQAHRVNVKYR